MITVRRQITFHRRSDHTKQIRVENSVAAEPTPTGRVPRISRLMALAIHFDQLLREGKIDDQSELARLVHVSQPRLTQIMNLNHLAPDIQEAMLHLPVVESGREEIHERMMRPVTAIVCWRRQRVLWSEIRAGIHLP